MKPGKFNLLEWVPLVVVLLCLAVALYQYLKPLYRGACADATIARMGKIATALQAFKADNGFYPPETNGLSSLVLKPANASFWRQYLTQIPNDYWGHAFRYECPGKHNTNSFDLSSAGVDGVFGTADDIGNWDATGGRK